VGLPARRRGNTGDSGARVAATSKRMRRIAGQVAPPGRDAIPARLR